MRNPAHRLLLVAIAAVIGSVAVADDDPAHERHELMEGVRDAAKPVGAMLRGKAEFDHDTMMASLRTFAAAGEELGDLFPDGSQGGEAAPAIWEDREGFEAKLNEWQSVTATAIAAAPKTLDAAMPVVGPVFDACKACHDSYRIEDE